MADASFKCLDPLRIYKGNNYIALLLLDPPSPPAPLVDAGGSKGFASPTPAASVITGNNKMM